MALGHEASRSGRHRGVSWPVFFLPSGWGAWRAASLDLCEVRKDRVFVRWVMTGLGLILSGMSFVATASGQTVGGASGAVETRTMTAELPASRPGRVIELHYNDAEMRRCVDVYQVEASRREIRAGEPVSFRVRIQRRCNGKSLRAPVPQTSVFSVRATGGKKSSSDGAESIAPGAPSFAFTHVFKSPGTYQVTVQNRLDEVEVHTVSFVLEVVHGAESENAR